MSNEVKIEEVIETYTTAMKALNQLIDYAEQLSELDVQIDATLEAIGTAELDLTLLGTVEDFREMSDYLRQDSAYLKRVYCKE